MTIPAGYQAPADLLVGRAILVTGAGQGLGRAVALACARHGATVALLGRSQEKLESTYDAIVEAGGPEPAMIPLDLAAVGSTELDSMAQLIRKDLRRLDGIAHCASHFVPLGPLADQTLETWMTLLKVNLAMPFAITRACLPLLATAPEGSVVFTGETHGAKPAAYWGGFAVSKSGLSPLAHIWADERARAPGPRMNVLIPARSPARSARAAIPARIRGRYAAPARPRARSSTSWGPRAVRSAEEPSRCDPRHRLFERQSVKLGFGRNSRRKSLHYHN